MEYANLPDFDFFSTESFHPNSLTNFQDADGSIADVMVPVGKISCFDEFQTKQEAVVIRLKYDSARLVAPGLIWAL
jgi:hypothetical protein